VAFNDLGSAATGGIFTPEDLASKYFNYAYEVGARVHSDSWGTNATSYDYMAAQVDLFSWDNQVVHMACLNEALRLRRGR